MKSGVSGNLNLHITLSDCYYTYIQKEHLNPVPHPGLQNTAGDFLSAQKYQAAKSITGSPKIVHRTGPAQTVNSSVKKKENF